MKQELVHMRDKLNNISKRNRSIRLLKLYDKWSFDLMRSSCQRRFIFPQSSRNKIPHLSYFTGGAAG